MINLTQTAREKILEIASKEELSPTVRAGIAGGGCAGYRHDLYFEEKDKIKDSDHVLEFDGVTLVVDMMSATYLDGTTIDYVDGLMGAGFKFDNGKYKKTCGCKQSFSV